MLIRKDDTFKKIKSPECTVREYNFINSNISIATTKINGIYPSKGKVINYACDIIYYVLSGKGVINTEKGEYKIKKGDSILLQKGKPYTVNGKNLLVTISSSPAWYLKQYKELE